MRDRNPNATDPLTIAIIGLAALFIPLVLIGLVAR
jgi:hypothetical protein